MFTSEPGFIHPDTLTGQHLRHFQIYKSSLKIAKVPMVKAASNEIEKEQLHTNEYALMENTHFSLLWRIDNDDKHIKNKPAANRYEWEKSRERFPRSALSARPSSVTLEVINHSPAGRPQWEPSLFRPLPPSDL